MDRLSVTTAWNESADFLRLHFGALFTIAVALIALPNVALQALGPAAAAGEAPEPGLWLLLFPLVILIGLVGSLTISTLALGREAVVGDAIRHAARRVLPMFGAALIVIALLCIVLAPLVLATGVGPADLVAPTPAKAGRILLLMLAILALAMFLAVRLLMMTPVAAAEPAGPVAILARSWALTRGRFWKLLGFVLLMSAAALVVLTVATLLVGLVVGLALGPPVPGTAGGLVMLLVAGLVNAAFVVVMTTIVARLYLQLAGGKDGPASGT